jgi:hypothetical protein
MDNAKEFRFVVKNADAINANAVNVSDFIDYYLSRTKRVRHFIKDLKAKGKFFLISTEPGMIKKEKKEITKAGAENLMKDAVLIVKKKGVGRGLVDGIEGYCERVSAFKPGKNKPFIDELHIEFETSQDNIARLEKIVKPLKIIKTGLFDYLSSAPHY